jgi:hypothetical protein
MMIRMRRPLRVALVGIDGCGKTTVASLLGDPGCVVLHTIHPDETIDGPFRELSGHLQTLSVLADRLHSPQLKIAAFYLLLRTYTPTERFFTQAFDPHTIVSDRHPLIDALVYLPLYRRVAAATPASAPDWKAGLDPDARRAIRAWARRADCEQDMWALGQRLLSLYTPDRDKLLILLSSLLKTALPDVVIQLDLEVDEALRRVKQRGRSGELHETAAQLSAVRGQYQAVLGWLASRPTPITVHRIDCGPGRSPDELAADVSIRLGTRILVAAA